jgi:hypothetical protein
MASADEKDSSEPPIALQALEHFLFAGRSRQNELGYTDHGDHGYAQYFVPQDARDTALILWHGIGQPGKCWESTPDGREGFR